MLEVSNSGEGKEAERGGKSSDNTVEDDEIEKEKYPNLAEKKARVWNALWLLRRERKRSSFLGSFAV